MKKTSNYFAMGALVLASLFTVSCDDDDDNNGNNNQTIAEIAVGNDNLSVLVDALNRTGLTATLDGSGSYTVFAPTNQAFNSFLQANGFANVEAVPVATLREILLNHVMTTENMSSSLTTGYVKTMAKGSASSTNTLSMFINTSSGVVLNGGTSNGGANVTTADIDASNGVVHIVNGVIGLPTVVNHAIANPNFNGLVMALTRADQPHFAGILGGTGPFTVFAPSNGAFNSLVTELSLNSIDDVPQSVLENALKYHVIAGSNVLSAQLTNNMMVTTFQGQQFTVELPSSGPQIKDANNRISRITTVDVQASNGVVHAIDKVLLPGS
ncbi:MAG: fasciclin domain-containing protein [Flavobacterium sp.]|nr:fasciclin domain-containing protein [Flavobacterium sp.]